MHTVTKDDGTKVLRTAKTIREEMEKIGIQVDQCEFIFNEFHLFVSKGYQHSHNMLSATQNLVKVMIPKEYNTVKHIKSSNDSFELIVSRK